MNKETIALLKFFFCIINLPILIGCSSFLALPTEYSIKATVDKQLNLDASGRSLSLVVRTYQLKDTKEFSKLTYDLISSGRQDSELLGSELNAQASEYVLVPDIQLNSKEDWKPGTKFIGVVGFFRRPDAQAWRFLLDAEKVRKNGLQIAVKNCYLSITSPDVILIPGQTADMHPECRVRPAVSSASNSDTL